MTAPVVPVTQDKTQRPRILTGDEWEAQQYAPHRQTLKPTDPQGAGRILTGDEWEQAQRSGSVRDLQFPALPKIQRTPFDKPAVQDVLAPPGSTTRNAKPLAPFDLTDPTTYLNPILRQVVNPVLENPLTSAAVIGAPVVATAFSPLLGAGIGVGIAGTMVHHIASYGWQKAAEMSLDPETRALAEADPERISGESAAVQALMLGLAPLIGIGARRRANRAASLPPEPPPIADEALARTVPVVAEADVAAARAADAARVAKGQEPVPYFESEPGAVVLGRTAAQRGLPPDASPYPPNSPLDAAWKQGHGETAQIAEGMAALESATAKAEVGKVPQAELPRGMGPKNLYRRLSPEALEAEYRALIKKQTAEQEQAIAPLWTEERHDAWVAAAENRRKGDVASQTIGNRDIYREEMVGTNRHTFESAAAEQRVNARAKHITALEQEMAGRGIDPIEVMQRAGGEGAGMVRPVVGTGEQQVRGLSASVEARAVERGLTDYLGDLPEYRSISMADQAQRASRLLTEDAALARKVALGEAPPPPDLLPESVFTAVENQAIAAGDVGTLRELASGGLAEQATTMGQRIRALAERNPESPVGAMQSVVKARTQGIKDAEATLTKTTSELRTSIASATKVDREAFTKFIDSLRCS